MSNLQNEIDRFDEFNRGDGRIEISVLLKDAWRGFMLGTHTIVPGRLVSGLYFDRTADIQPALMQKYKSDKEPVTIPPIPRIPVTYMGVPGACILVPDNLITEGLECLLLVCERSIDAWYKQGGIVDPADERIFDFTDAVAMLGFGSEPNLPTRKGATTSLEIQYGQAWLEITKSGKFKIKNNSQSLTGVLNALAGTLQGSTAGGNPVIWTGAQPSAILAEISSILE